MTPSLENPSLTPPHGPCTEFAVWLMPDARSAATIGSLVTELAKRWGTKAPLDPHLTLIWGSQPGDRAPIDTISRIAARNGPIELELAPQPIAFTDRYTMSMYMHFVPTEPLYVYSDALVQHGAALLRDTRATVPHISLMYMEPNPQTQFEIMTDLTSRPAIVELASVRFDALQVITARSPGESLADPAANVRGPRIELKA